MCELLTIIRPYRAGDVNGHGAEPSRSAAFQKHHVHIAEQVLKSNSEVRLWAPWAGWLAVGPTGP